MLSCFCWGQWTVWFDFWYNLHMVIFQTLKSQNLIYSNSKSSSIWPFSGKRWVECRNKGQISIPDSIDTETQVNKVTFHDMNSNSRVFSNVVFADKISSSIQVLDFSGNNLQILPREVFSRHGLLNLQKLKLSYCNIGESKTVSSYKY